MNDEIADLREQLEQTEELLKLTNVTLAKTARRLAKAEEFLLQRVREYEGLIQLPWGWHQNVRAFLKIKNKS